MEREGMDAACQEQMQELKLDKNRKTGVSDDGRLDIADGNGIAPSEMEATQREEFGFKRTICSCAMCSTFCQHMPGFLVPSDLARLIPANQDPFEWAEQHLRASRGFIGIDATGFVAVPSLVPAKNENGHCHWFQDGQCRVHKNSPFGCAFLDQHMTDGEAEKRNAAGRAARKQSFNDLSVYAQVWQYLWDRGLVYLTSTEDRRSAIVAIRKIRQRAESKKQRQDRKRLKKLKKRQRRNRKRR